MPICLYCERWGRRYLCLDCSLLLRPVPVSVLESRFRVFSGLAHETVARRLVHLLKYQALRPAAQLLADVMVEAMPADVVALVPVPRATLRRVRYGCDAAVVLARAIAAATGVPVNEALRPNLWWPPHAGQRKAARRVPGFRVVAPLADGSVLVDDVLTTGATLRAAGRVTGLHTALTATRAGRGSAR
jgi:predicted amidophosphoribosyltransferase